ncbi:ML domain-containing protein [Gilbertella persicaria]|uniref:ML domain-containing protein n=1 Tax=Gilbertella persicaria TaxID=101096 RepID=UPI0022203416|nr:ML domain-containing protein [Gilbertella persicaria]KAI8087726.1 ML domain-containing protein [Gilbertella persicaria]
MLFKTGHLLCVFLLICSSVSARLFYWPSDTYSFSTNSFASNVQVKVCSKPDYALKIRSVKITPEIVVPGGEVIIQATGTVYEPVLPGSEADVVVKFGVVKLLHKKFDICNELEKKKDDVELQCPIDQGDLTVTQKVTLPKEIPKGKFAVLVHATTADNHPLTCLQVLVDFRNHRRLLSENRFLRMDLDHI